MPTIAELVSDYPSRLPDSDSATLDIELLLAFVLEKDRSYIKAFPEYSLSDDQLAQFSALATRRIAGEPIAYILGTKGFWSLDLKVSEHTLIPRPETELLVETVLELLTGSSISVLDLGTGTGAIALALAAERPSWNVTATDVRADALALAKDNAEHFGLSNVEFIQSDWFTAITTQRFDVIVSNPPYIDENDPHLSQGDVRFEPKTALVAADKGMADIQHIIQSAGNYLNDGGWLAIEHGYNQGALARELLSANEFQQIKTLEDLAGQDRVSLGQWFNKQGTDNG